MPEPKRLRNGKKFHKAVQREWQSDAEGDITSEKSTIKLNGRRSRIDIHVGEENGLVAVVEIKCSDWDAMTPKAVRRNVKRYTRQILDYIDAEMKQDVSVSTGVIFPKQPESNDRRVLVEQLFWDEGIPVVWQDETIENCRKRNLIEGNEKPV